MTTKERPILFSGAMVRAILDGRKTQTRRVVKQATGPSLSVDCNEDGIAELSWLHGPGPGYDIEETIKHVTCPYGAPGDSLWVRETFFAFGRWETRFNAKKGRDEWHFVDLTLEMDRIYQYADPTPSNARHRSSVTPAWWKRPAIHMPRAASRITLENIDVGVERLQSMSHDDLWSEGIGELLEDPDSVPGRAFNEAEHYMIGGVPMKHIPEIYGFAALWDSLNGAGAWEANPWVWVVEFRRAS